MVPEFEAPSAENGWAINDEELDLHAEREFARLKSAGDLITVSELIATLPRQREEITEVISEVDGPLAPPEIVDRLRESVLAVGYGVFCDECRVWHVNFSTGFVIAEDGVVCTSLHVFEMAEDENPDECHPVAMDIHGNLYPITALLAADAESDTCFVRLAGGDHLPPLPLAETTRVGERIFLLSHPDARYFRFSEGIVSRLVFQRRERGGRVLLVDGTAEFAPGSSGGPLVNDRCEVVGHVSTIAGVLLAEDGSADGGSAVTERLGVAARSIRDLTEAGRNPRSDRLFPTSMPEVK